MSNIKMKKPSLTVAIIMGISLALLFSFLSIRNTLVTMSEEINSNWAQVENQLQRRSDLIPNLVSTVKGYAKHEQTVFDNIANARAKLAGAGSQNEKIAAAGEFQSAISRLLVIVEQYPLLKADRQFTQLMDELAGTENRLSVERKNFNQSIKNYNMHIKKFPAIIVAMILNYDKKTYFEVTEKAKELPQVNF